MSLAVVADITSGSRPRRRQDVPEIIEGLHRRNPSADRDRLAQLLVDKLLGDRDLMFEASRILVERVLQMAQARLRRAAAQPDRRRRAERRSEEKAEVQQLAAKVRGAVLDMLIDGKALRFHTGAEVARLGAGFVKLAERVPADCLVGEILCERQAQELMLCGS